MEGRQGARGRRGGTGAARKDILFDDEQLLEIKMIKNHL